jgi:hypothetical protein
MTSETKTLIEAADITGIEIECPECHLTIFYPTAVREVIKIGPHCPHCNLKFFDDTQTRGFGNVSYPAIDNVQTIAAHLRMLAKPDRTDIHAKIRFRVNVETKAAK